MFLDSDDYLDAKEADAMISELNEEVDVLMGLYCEVYSNDDKGQKEKSQAFLKLKGLTNITDFLTTLPIDGKDCYMTAWRFVCRRTFLMEKNLFFMPGIYHEDEEWSQRLFVNTEKVFVTHYYFYQYRQARVGSIMASTKPKRIYDRFAIIQKGTEIIRKTETAQAVREYIQKQLALIYYANLVDYHILDKETKRRILPLYEQFQYLIEFQNNRKGEIVRFVRKLMGIRCVCNMFVFLHRIRSVFK